MDVRDDPRHLWAAPIARGPMKALNGAIVQPNAGHAMVNVRKGVIV